MCISCSWEWKSSLIREIASRDGCAKYHNTRTVFLCLLVFIFSETVARATLGLLDKVIGITIQMNKYNVFTYINIHNNSLYQFSEFLSGLLPMEISKLL